MPRAASSPGIFISYRRDDSAGFAGRLYDRLAQRFGPDRVFMDIDTIQPGHEFAADIERALSECAACVVLIGRHWASITSADGGRRLDDPTDFVRLEVAAAIRRGVTVFPVLVDGATPPPSNALPEDIRGISGRQAIELSNERWNYDVGRLVLALDSTVGKGAQARERRTRSMKRPALVAGALVLASVVGLVAWLAIRPAPYASIASSASGSSPGGSNASVSSPPVFSGIYDVNMTLRGFSNRYTLYTNNLWGENQPYAGEPWSAQKWHFTSAGSHALLTVPSLSKTADFKRSGDVYTDTSYKATCRTGDPVPVTRELDVTPIVDAGQVASFHGWFTIHWTCPEGEMRGRFTIKGTRE